jgi:hypothetical protein
MFPQAFCTEGQNDLDELCGGFLVAAVFGTSQNSIRGVAIYDSFLVELPTNFVTIFIQLAIIAIGFYKFPVLINRRWYL